MPISPSYIYVSIFGAIQARLRNRKAQNPPRVVRDYSSGNLPLVSDDSTAFACVDKIASSFAALNYAVYDSRTRQKAARSHLMAILKEPNTEERHFNFFYQSAVDYFSGGCYWLKVMSAGELVSLFRLPPHLVMERRSETSREREYMYQGDVYTSREVLFIPSRFSYNTLRGGQSIYNAARSVFDTARDLESYTQSAFTNGTMGRRLVIDVQGALPNITEEQAAEIRNSFAASYGGARNAGKPLLKKKGFEFSELGAAVDNRAQELLDNRKFQEHEVAKVFGIPEGILNTTAETNLENTFTVFNEFAIRPLAMQFQEAINTLLDEDRQYFEFDFNGVMKVSLASRIDAYSKQINAGLLSPNEARAKENLPPIEAGDTFFMPSNMMPLTPEVIEAYMAKQKNEAAMMNPTDPDAQHFAGGDDKQ